MLIDIVTQGTTNYSCMVRVVDSSDGTPETSVAYNTAGVDLWYRRPGALHASITEVTQTENGAHTDGGFVHISDGYCRLDLPDAAVAAGADYVDVGGTFTDMIVIGGRIKLGPAWLTQTQITGGAYALDTDANGRIRIVDGTGAGELNTESGGVLLADSASHGGSSMVVTGDHMIFTSSDGPGLYLAGDFVSPGLYTLGGGPAAGFRSDGGSSGGPGCQLAGGPDASGLQLAPNGTAIAFEDASGNAVQTGSPAETTIITNATGTPTATTLDSSDFSSAQSAAYVGGLIIILDGTYAGCRARVTDFTPASDRLTITELPGAPANGTRFVWLGGA